LKYRYYVKVLLTALIEFSYSNTYSPGLNILGNEVVST